MRVEIEAAGLARTLPAPRRRSLSARRLPRLGLDRFELLALLLFGAISLWVVWLDAYRSIVQGLVWTGTDGFYIVDQMQYLAWIRDASHHLLASNLFVLRGTPADYLQPAIAISGGLVALGMAPWLALLLWKPVAVAVVFWGIRALVNRSLPAGWSRRATLALALFFGSFSVIYGSVGVVGDLFLGFLSWGYTFGLLALGLMLLSLLAYERGRRSASNRRLAGAAVLGAVASWLHPWQGELLILIILAAEAAVWWTTRRRPARPVALALTVAGIGLPLLYYLLLGRADESWQLARAASKHSFSLPTILLGLAPLALAALPAYLRRPRSFLAAATRAWPLAALAIYGLSASDVSATPLHAFEGVTAPLAVLAVEGARRVGLGRLRAAPAWAALLVAAGTVPAVAYEMDSARRVVAPTQGNPNFIQRDEQRALRFLAHERTPGGVLSRFYLGSVVPGETGRRTFVGDCLWSQPHCGPRARIAQIIFDGTLSAPAARSLVEMTGARFVLADCQTRPDMDRVLAPITDAVRHFGCAAVYQLKPAPASAAPLAESALDAALRASGRQQRGGQSR